MKRFQNATMEYNVNKNDLVIRDVNTNGIFFYFLQILSGILFKNLWYNWSVFKSKRGV